MLLANRREQRPLRLGQLSAPAAVRARRWPEGFQTARFIGVIPALQRRHREGLRRVGSWWSEALLAQLGERQCELAAVELAARQRSDDLAANSAIASAWSL